MGFGATGGLVLGVASAAMETYARIVGPADGSLAALAHALQRFPAGDQHWSLTLQFLWLVPLLVVVPLNLREAGPNDRRRFVWLTLGITVGLFPLVANLFLQTFSPAYVALVTEASLQPDPLHCRLRRVYCHSDRCRIRGAGATNAGP